MAQYVKDMFVYEYTFLDDLSFIKPIEEYFNTDYKDALEELFKNNGWEGDGEIGVIWFPPFIGVGEEDTHGHYVFHVKQSNNGISFLASSIRLPFARLLEQNEFSKHPKVFNTDGYEEVNIVQCEVNSLKEILTSYKNNIIKELDALTTMSDTDLAKEIKEKILGYNQSMIILYLNEFIDDCYLNILMEVLNNGNSSNIKLSRSSVKIDLSRHYPDEEDGAKGDWLTIQMMISDIWKSYKFEGFKEKLNKLIKPLEYVISPDIKKEILKHVVIRNCIQHHDWQLEASSLNILGTDSIEILDEQNSTIKILKWKTIILSKEELIKFIDMLIVFADDFSSYVSQRVASRVYTNSAS